MKLETSKVVVAMSGGVDSSVAAALLSDQGYEAIGVSMQVWDYRQNGGCKSRATCCAPDDFTDARMVASKIGVPYYVFDFEQTFRKEVIDKFVQTYRAGKTPNPCVDCNNKVKFKELRNRAQSFDCAFLATGHYAQIEKREDGYHLLRGKDAKKDQSYFLYGISQTEMKSTLFPVGHLTKDEVRAIAKERNLPTAEKPESQDICFVSGEVDDFLVRLGTQRKQGAIRTTAGELLGSHSGIHQFTVGQRRGLNVGGKERPLYVLELHPEANEVVVGEKEELERQSFEVEELNWCCPISPKIGETITCSAQLRYRHPGVKVEVQILSKDRAKVQFTDSWTIVSPGQAAVFYDLQNQEVFGGGRIVKEEVYAFRNSQPELRFG